MIFTDVLVIGSGAAGLSFALKTAQKNPAATITILTKAIESECNTNYAQGGVAVVMNLVKDNFEKHIQDTLRAGDGICKLDTVEVVVKEGPERIRELIEWGTQFDKDTKGQYDLGREGGHTENRVMHYKDVTGAEIERSLIAAVKGCKNINLLENYYAIELLQSVSLNRCEGAAVLDLKTGKIETIAATITVLACGGAGHVYRNTTNPIVATGDGIALAHRAGAKVGNMQFIQFHPTAFYSDIRGRLSLVSEAVRGFGAKLRTISGEAFMHKYDEREELASRDIVARAIYNEMKERGENHVCLDCRHLDREKFLAHFPNIYQQCKDDGFDLFEKPIPVVPASHYLCGGIDVDLDGMTSVDHLFAIGECSNTGLHGANRLASNSLLEALIFGHRAAMKTTEMLAKEKNQTSLKSDVFSIAFATQQPDLKQIETLRLQLQDTMSLWVGIVRSYDELYKALDLISSIQETVDNLCKKSAPCLELLELKNLAATALLIIAQSIEQKENKGAYFNKDIK